MTDDDVTIFPSLAEGIRAAMGAVRETGGSVYICRGARVGCARDGAEKCADCYEVADGERLDADEHARRFLRGNA